MSETIESLFSGLKDIPDEFLDWIKRDEEQSNIIYYQRNGKKADYWCCQCGKTYSRNIVKPDTAIEELAYGMGNVPQRYERETCKVCGATGKLDWRKCAGIDYIRIKTNIKRYYLWQTDNKGNLVIRQFRRVTDRQINRGMSTFLIELLRVFLAPGMRKEYERCTWSKKWYETRRRITKDYEMTGLSFGGIDGISKAIAESNMHYFPIDEYVKVYNPDASIWQLNSGAKVNIMMACAKTPVIEMIHKIGMDELAREIIRDDGVCGIIYKNGKTLEKVLRVKKADIKWIVQQEDKIAALRTCQVMQKRKYKANNKTREDIYNYVFHTGSFGRIDKMLYILQYMSIEQAKNRIEKYKAEYSGAENSAITEYADYLRMRKGLGYDMKNELYLNPRSLKETYTKLRVEDESRKNEKYINEMLEQFPKIAKRFNGLDKKYHYETDELLIRPAKDAAEIVLEGRTLHHCVGSSNQRYMSNHNAGKNVILVLRKKACEDVPYITVEIDKNFDVQQWYGANDKKPDREMIEEFLSGYKAAKTEKQKKTA